MCTKCDKCSCRKKDSIRDALEIGDGWLILLPVLTIAYLFYGVYLAGRWAFAKCFGWGNGRPA